MNIRTEFDTEYYIAELDEPLPLRDPWGRHWYPEIDEWCKQTFGVQDIWGESPVKGWKRMRNKYFFTDQAKLNWFITRWS
jgi:hypothetical protein